MIYYILMSVCGCIAIIGAFQAARVEGRIRMRFYKRIMNTRLKIHVPGKEPSELSLSSCSYVIGRRPRKCDIRISHESVSRIHALLMRAEDGFQIQPAYNEDDKSLGQVFVNGRDLFNQPRQLRDGDRISLGQVQIYYLEG